MKTSLRKHHIGALLVIEFYFPDLNLRNEKNGKIREMGSKILNFTFHFPDFTSLVSEFKKQRCFFFSMLCYPEKNTRKQGSSEYNWIDLNIEQWANTLIGSEQMTLMLKERYRPTGSIFFTTVPSQLGNKETQLCLLICETMNMSEKLYENPLMLTSAAAMLH